MRRRDGSGCPRYLARPRLSASPSGLAWGRARTPHRPPAPRRGQAAAGGPGAGRVTPAFITVTLDDEGGSEVIDLLDISRLARARGAAKGSRIRFKDGTTIDVQDDAKRITDALRDVGVMRGD